MDKKLILEKLQFWRDREKLLEEKFKKKMKQRGEAAQEGDLSENASYEMATQDAQLASAQLAQVKKAIKGLEEQLDASH